MVTPKWSAPLSVAQALTDICCNQLLSECMVFASSLGQQFPHGLLVIPPILAGFLHPFEEAVF